VGGSILAPLFNGGRIRAQADAAAARREQAAWAYRGVALTAFAEVENGLESVQQLEEQGERARAQRDALARSLRLAHNRYSAGYASYLERARRPARLAGDGTRGNPTCRVAAERGGQPVPGPGWRLDTAAVARRTLICPGR